MCFPPPGSPADQAWLERIPVKSRGLKITEVVFFLITYKNRSIANHQPCDLLQVTGPLNSVKKAKVSSFQTMWYFELFSGLRALDFAEGKEMEIRSYLSAVIKRRTQ